MQEKPCNIITAPVRGVLFFVFVPFARLCQRELFAVFVGLPFCLKLVATVKPKQIKYLSFFSPSVRWFVCSLVCFFSLLLLVDARMLGWRQLGPPDTESGTNCVRKLQSIDRMVKSHLCLSDWNGAGTVGHNRETRLRKHTHTQALVWSSSSPARRGIF